MTLPRGIEAVIDPAKLLDDVLSDTHPRGRHKAAVFRSRLGLSMADADDLAAQLKTIAASSSNAIQGDSDQYGTRYSIDGVVTGPRGSGVVRSAWIVESEGDAPRFLTRYLT